MGLFDSWRRASKQQSHNSQQEQAKEEEKIKEEVPSPAANLEEIEEEQDVTIAASIEDAEVVERDVSRETFDEEEGFVAQPIKKYADKKPVKHAIGTTKIIAILNQKGGVGKSTTAINLSAALGELGKQVLLVDLDPQGNATSGLGIDKGQLEACIYDVIVSERPITDVIIPDVCDGLDIAPSTINLAGAEVELVSMMAREVRLKEAIGEMRGKYDYIFIDCPPSLGLLTVNALVAADKLLIPIQCEFYALEGVTKLLDSMKRVKNYLNPSLDIFGVLLTMSDRRTTLSKQVASEVRKYFPKTVFEVEIPRTVKISEAPSYGMPITQYDPNGKGALAYKTLAQEVIRRG
ncbi:Sporulation initiation inhibitor protein soj [Slackia heliotrinireducens]|uniref:Chromosome segregation ATPase n=1 Tax=Slackia heliotrinireducens (strain ATCC 29202 / DSM 20476 / NCTC 11029 / RHS 1) TaxID=471855 RepID=C7N499_SLAHD|nr:chromosome segregation ATPase [Slackia heliotrinireducens DSM 20476]VEH03541.1 Sporulation initiation inhibitor protein soj [Slackia heliotrinireducens]